MTTTQKLIAFVNQRPGLDFANYGDIKAYRSESRSITKDKAHFFELLALAQSRIPDFDAKLTKALTESNGRLTMNDKGELQYCAGQYFPTEYRPAACGIIKGLIWDDYRDEVWPSGELKGKRIYETGHEIRKAIKRQLSRGAAGTYFN